jgi:hypothetical protein
LVDCDLGGVNAPWANFTRASLQRADFAEAELTEAIFEGGALEEVNLAGANCERSNFAEADLSNAKLEGACLEGADLRKANLDGASLKRAMMAGARLHGAELDADQLEGVEAEWLDMTAEGDGSKRTALADFGKLGQAPAADGKVRRFFGAGDVLRNAELEFDDGAHVEIQSRFERCNIRLGKDAELIVGAQGRLEDCTIVGGRLRVLGKFLEKRSPGLIDTSQLFVSEHGAVAATLKQPAGSTQFAFERGCRLRVHIMPAATTAKQES